MHNILMVLRREYLQRVTKKSFWIGTALFPLIMSLFFVAPWFLMKVRSENPKPIALIDATGKVGSGFKEVLAKRKLKDGREEFPVESVPATGGLEAARKTLEPRIERGDLYGILTVAEDVDAKDAFRFYGKNVGNFQVISSVESALRDAVVGLRLERSNLTVDRQTLDKITARVDLATFQVTESGGARKSGFAQAYLGTYAFIMVLYMSLLIYGIAMMRGILEEKSNRVMEVLLGSVTPDQLMTGKILGIGLVGLTQLAVYLVTAGVLRLYFAGAALSADSDMAGVLDAFTLGKLGWFMLFFLLGYFFFTGLFAAVGAVCNTEEEAQNLQSPVVMSLVLPMVATIFFVTQPDSNIAVVVSMIPLFTPMVMYMRISVLTPPLWQILLSAAIMVASIWLLYRGVAKIFRIGVLMYGKRPTIPEILRWARS